MYSHILSQNSVYIKVNTVSPVSSPPLKKSTAQNEHVDKPLMLAAKRTIDDLNQ